MKQWFVGLLDRLFALVGALLFAQLPMFILQYTQQLAGRASELSMQLNSLHRIAEMNGKSLEQYFQKFINASDPDFIQQGVLMQKLSQRFYFLSQAEIDISNASVFSKPFVFFQHFDTEIARSTLQYFHFGIPISMEGFVYALAGLGFGCMVFYLISRFCKMLRRAVGNFRQKVSQ